MYIKKGKKTKAWDSARADLKKVYFNRGITSCELRFVGNGVVGCSGGMFLGCAHRYKRRDPKCEHTFEQTILCCTNCHQVIEYNRELSERCFEYLRGQDGVKQGCQNLLVDMECKRE